MKAKHYVSLEAAKKLKELGYDEHTQYCYNGTVVLPRPYHLTGQEYYLAPTLLEAMDWLEEKELRISARYDWIECGWYYVITNGMPTVQTVTEVEITDSVFYKDRNECMQKAIEKALELL